MLFGSHVYGTSTPESDTDYKTVFVPSGREVLLGTAPKTSESRSTGDGATKNRPGDVDEEAFPLVAYLRLLCEGQTVAVDMLFTPERFWTEVSQSWYEVLLHRDRLLSSRVSAFVGYCRSQANKYGIKGSRMAAVRRVLEVLRELPERDRLADHWDVFADLVGGGVEHVDLVAIPHRHTGVVVDHLEVCGRKAPSTLRVRGALDMYGRLFEAYGERARAAERSEGIDWKALMHAVRVLGQARELLGTGYVTFPRPDATHLLRVRLGELPYRQVAEQIEQGVEELPSLVAGSPLRSDPDRELAEEMVLAAHLRQVGVDW